MGGKLIAIIEAFSECLYLITIASESDNILNAVMLKVKHERLLLLVECHSHTCYYALWLQRYNFNFRKKRERGIFLKKSINTQAPPLLLCTKFSDNSQYKYIQVDKLIVFYVYFDRVYSLVCKN